MSRKNYLINPKFQITIIGYNLIFIILTFLVIAIAHNYFFDYMLQAGIKNNLGEGHIFYDILK